MIANLIYIFLLCGVVFFLYTAYGSYKKNNRNLAFINLALGIIMALFFMIGFLGIRNLIIYGVLLIAYYIVMALYMVDKRKQRALKNKIQSSNKPKAYINKKGTK